jgi:hypothetical protein
MALIFLLYPPPLSSLEVVRGVLMRGCGEAEVLVFDLVPFAEVQAQLSIRQRSLNSCSCIVFACARVSKVWSLVLLEQLRSR